MATTLYLRNAVPDLAPSPNGGFSYLTVRDSARAVTVGADTMRSMDGSALQLSTTVGTGGGNTLTLSTVAGATAGKVFVLSGAPYGWLSPPLDADVTISGTVSFRACGLESSMSANATFRYILFRVTADGVFNQIVSAQSASELGTSLAARDFTATPTSTACNKGDRLAVFCLIDDAGTMGSGYTVTFYFNGSNANTADSYVQLNETVSFLTSAPSGSSYYLRDTASDANPGSASEKAMATTQGSGTATAVHTTLTGPLTYPGDQWTATAGGTDIEWYTPQFEAFALGGVVQVDVGKGAFLELNGSPWQSLVVELAVCDGDGTNPVVWSRSLLSTQDNTAAVSSYYLSGDDVSVTAGQRLRLRFYSDDYHNNSSSAQASGTNYTIRYDGTSSYASRIVLTQSVTEYTPATPLAFPFRRRDLRIVPLI